MLPWFTENFGNPASRSHVFGWQASEAVEVARTQVAQLLEVNPKEIFFTSGSTEGLNMAIKGLAESSSHRGKHIISVATEHHAVIDPLKWLEKRGYTIDYLPVREDGLIELDMLKQAIRKDTLMVIVLWANNETGVIQDMGAIGAVCSEMGVPLVSDATQAFGKIAVEPKKCHVDIVSVSAHKIYGPKGIGALYINQSLKPKPDALIHGGGHEEGFRAGTLNVPGIVGLGEAAAICKESIDSSSGAIRAFRDHFEGTILKALEKVSINGHPKERLPSVSNIAVMGVDSQAVMSRFRTKLAISSGSACSSAHPAPSHVLLAMGLTAAEAKSSFRISFGTPTTKDEVDRAAQLFIDAINTERAISPIWQMIQEGIDLS